MQRLVWLVMALVSVPVAGCATGAVGGLRLAELPPGVTPVDGARVVVTAEQLRGGVDDAVSLRTRLDDEGRFKVADALDWLERLRAAHNAQAAERFGLVPDSVDLWLDPDARMGTLRLLTVALVQAGFKHVAIVGSTPAGARTAVTLRPGYLPSRASTNLSLRWGFDPSAGVEVGRIVDGQYIAENAPKCPMVPRVDKRLETARIATFAQKVCGESKDGGRIGLGLSASPSTPWREVAELASLALGASGCHAFVYLEPPKTLAVGCKPRLKAPVTGPPNYACDKHLVAKAVRRQVNQIRACYERSLKSNRQLRGRVVLRWKIGHSGLVESVAITRDTLSDPQVGRCMRAKVVRWRFPAPRDGGSCVISYPFVFQPASP